MRFYAVSYAKTPLKFPMVWARDADYIHAVNVTDRYTQLGEKAPEGTTKVYFRVIDLSTGRRVAAKLSIAEQPGEPKWSGITNDEGFDANDHLGIYLPIGAKLTAKAVDQDRSGTTEFTVSADATVTIGVKGE